MKVVVQGVAAAQAIVVSARTARRRSEREGMSLFVVPATAPGVSIQGYPLVDGGRGGDLSLNHVQLPADALVGTEGEAAERIDAARAAGVIALSAEALGAMDALKAATLEHLRTRRQFGAPIGKFQALQHRMTTVMLEIEQARSALINAAAMLDSEARTRDRAASACKVTFGRVGALVAEEAIHMHGGIGMTDELAVSHYAKRLIMIGHQQGDDDHHLSRYIALTPA